MILVAFHTNFKLYCYFFLFFLIYYNFPNQSSDTRASFTMNSDDYELTRNLTLMFFLDRLMDKGQPRSLHDLSCQFGTKGFTKEMKQIAGNSQSGLRKFLNQYPYLFTIEGDQVCEFVFTFKNSIINAISLFNLNRFSRELTRCSLRRLSTKTMKKTNETTAKKRWNIFAKNWSR